MLVGSGSSLQVTLASDGCVYCLPPWRIERRGVHETARGVCEEWPRKPCVPPTAQYIWTKTVTPMLESCIRQAMGFKQTASDPCLYVYMDSEGELLVVAIYVDDIILGEGMKLN